MFMSKCTRPIYALDLGIKENGKRNIKILSKRADLSSLKQLQARYGADAILPLPCGKCLACRLAKAKEWAVRCTLEAMDHDENWFLTLTYDDEHLPADGMLQRSDLQKFLKRLRARLGPFRYFGCGEYGSKNNRPHFHLILFGLHLDDLKPVGSGLVSSPDISEAWPFGFHYLGDVTYNSCNYVARYTTKKLFNDVPDGEFICASTHPGIGYNWCKEHLSQALEYDSVFGDFGATKAVKLPRYFDKIAEILDKGRYDEVKAHRLDNKNVFQINELLIHGIDEVEKLYEYKENSQINEFKRKGLGRSL